MTIGLRDAVKKDLASSGKSPAYRHHRNNRARAGKLVAGFLHRTAAAFQDAASSHAAYRRQARLDQAAVRTIKAEHDLRANT
jgi:hypothetical protein